jgi:RNA polymerase sigma-32 factor
MPGSDRAALDRADIRFIQGCMKTPVLSRASEQSLAVAWRDRHDQRALNQLILAYSRLVVSAAFRLRGYGLPLGDLIQEGNIGLMEAATRFDPGRENRFSTYASWWIRAAMQDYILRNWSIVRTGTTSTQKTLFFNLRRLRAQHADPSRLQMSMSEIDRIASTLKVAPHEIEIMEQRLAAADSSLNARVAVESDESWQDMIADSRPTPEEAATSTHDTDRRRCWLALALDQLPGRERRIVEARHLGDPAKSLEQLGRELGVSKERVRQLEQRALRRLRKDVLSLAEQVPDPPVRAVFAPSALP